MRIGYSVEGSTDRALLEGLRRRWCPGADFVEGPFRGSTRESLRREYRKICAQVLAQRADVMVFLTDAGDERWQDVQRTERSKFPQDCLGLAVHGVAERNVECWLCSAPGWLAGQLRAEAPPFGCANPKGAFEAALGVSRDDMKEEEIAELVRRAPLRDWLSNRSFRDFYDQLRDRSQQLGCAIENLLDG